MLMTGAPPISSLETSGVFASFGKITAATLSRTSFVASLMSRSKKNFTITTETPSEEVEVMESIPPILESASSILSVTCDSMVLDSAPGYTVCIVTIGKSIFGNSAEGILLKLIKPKITSVTTYISVVIGLFMADLYILFTSHLYCLHHPQGCSHHQKDRP